MRKWARLWFGRYEKFNIKKNFKPKKRKLLNMMVPNFLYSNSYHFLTLLSSSLLLSLFLLLLLLLLLLLFLVFLLLTYF